AGSQVLREVGHLLKARIRHAGATPARYGGDEFVLVVPSIDLDAAVTLAEDVRQIITNTTFVDQAGDIHPDALGLLGITCSIGVATLGRHITPDVTTVEEVKSALLRLADTAMYVAKDRGRNRIAVADEPVPRPDPTLSSSAV
ncbi:MAG: GGDEF domain-containing protein, partial [Acidobacteriota bacterium]